MVDFERRIRLAIPAAAIMLAACEPTSVSTSVSLSVPTQLDATYALTHCIGAYQGTNPVPPCKADVAASHSDYVDSARLVFSRDRTVQWMVATHMYFCPCYLGGCTQPCSHEPGRVDTGVASYVVSGGEVTLDLQSLPPYAPTRLTGSIPDRVSAGWTGPDSLVFHPPYVPPLVYTRQ
jgi:hypothetical protein